MLLIDNAQGILSPLRVVFLEVQIGGGGVAMGYAPLYLHAARRVRVTYR